MPPDCCSACSRSDDRPLAALLTERRASVGTQGGRPSPDDRARTALTCRFIGQQVRMGTTASSAAAPAGVSKPRDAGEAAPSPAVPEGWTRWRSVDSCGEPERKGLRQDGGVGVQADLAPGERRALPRGFQVLDHRLPRSTAGDGAGETPHRREKSREKKPLADAASLACPGHRCAEGTPLRTWSTCCPQPAQVVLPHVLHATARHMIAPSRQPLPVYPARRREYPLGYGRDCLQPPGGTGDFPAAPPPHGALVRHPSTVTCSRSSPTMRS